MSLAPQQAGREAGDRPALVFAGPETATIRFGELAAAAPAALRPGRLPVAVEALPHRDALLAFYGGLARGVTIVPLDPRLGTRERADFVAASGPFDAPRPAGAGASGEAPPPSPPDDERPLAIVATSGSSGSPRGVELSRAACAASARASAANLGWRDDDLWALVLPWSHVGGLSILLRCLHARRPVLVCGRFDPQRTARALERHRATLLSLVPTMLDLLLELPERAFPPPSLRAVLLGGAAAPETLVARARARGVPVLRTYGMTETCSQVATERPDRPHEGLRALAGVELRVRAGEIEVRGPMLATGYRPGGPLPRTADGFFRTGDLGSITQDGRLVVHGRADDRINTGGEMVVPDEIEAALRDVPGIADALVFGLDDPRWGQIVAAALVPAGTPPADHALAAAIAVRLGPARRPRRIAWLDEMPRTGPAKPDRREAARLAGARLVPLRYGGRS